MFEEEEEEVKKKKGTPRMRRLGRLPVNYDEKNITSQLIVCERNPAVH